MVSAFSVCSCSPRERCRGETSSGHSTANPSCTARGRRWAFEGPKCKAVNQKQQTQTSRAVKIVSNRPLTLIICSYFFWKDLVKKNPTYRTGVFPVKQMQWKSRNDCDFSPSPSSQVLQWFVSCQNLTLGNNCFPTPRVLIIAFAAWNQRVLLLFARVRWFWGFLVSSTFALKASVKKK